MKIVGKITDWQLRSETPGKRTWMRYNRATDEIEVVEEWFEEVPLREAKTERELFELSGGRSGDMMAPICVIPKSVQSKAIKEGWHEDDAKWRRWMNDIDNRHLRIKGGTV